MSKSFKQQPENQSDSEMISFTNGKRYIKEHYMESNSDNEQEIDYHYRKENDKLSKVNQNIDTYKLGDITSMNNLKSKTISSNSCISNKLNQSSNQVIKNYLKTKETGDDFRLSSMTSTRKFNDLSKKNKNSKDMTKAKLSNSSTLSSTSPSKLTTHYRPSSEKLKKSPKSPVSIYGRQESTLDEFQIEKVVSWMSVNEDNFSEYEYSMPGALNDNKTKVDSTYQEIANIIKEIEHDRKDTKDLKSLKTDIEFKLNTILGSIDSADDDISVNECNKDLNSKSK